MLRVILNKSWRQRLTRHQLYGHLPPITKTIQVRRTRHAGHCWRSRDELISDVLLRTPTYGRAKAGRPARTYIQQLREDTGCSPEDLPEAMNDWEKWREMVRDIRASGMTWWYIYIYNNTCGSAIAEHLIKNCFCASTYSADLFTILSRSHSDFHLKVFETISILTHKPSLCKQTKCLFGFNIITI